MYIELVEALCDMCIRQASILRDQAYVLSTYGAEIHENEIAALGKRLSQLVKDWGDGDAAE